MEEQKLFFICEVCNKVRIITPSEARREGWIHPPIKGKFGYVSPRICKDCDVRDTLWWALVTEQISSVDEMTDAQYVLLCRINEEPDSITMH